MLQSCKHCGLSFEIGNDDLSFYDAVSPEFNGVKYQIPPPSLCPDCRQKRRLAWRNERALYKRTCDATKKSIISVFSADKPLRVYDNDYWYSDSWDARQYGRDFDFSRPFFDQFQELIRSVPQLARSGVGNLNSDYTNQCGWCKNCYLIFEADGDEDCLYSNNLYDSKVCVDLLSAERCELCYECVDCKNCYHLKYSQDCDNCSDSLFLKSCASCRNCFGCVNLRNKEYHFFNQPYSPDEYQRNVAQFQLYSYAGIQAARHQFSAFAQQFPQKYFHGTNNENSCGDYLWNTQNCFYCFNLLHAQDCKFVFNSRNVKQVQDMTVFGAVKGAEFCYENHEIGDSVRNVCFSDQIWTGCSEIYYSKLCLNGSHHLFGCVGIRHGSYCVLNKEYSKEEYEALVPRIIEHMKKTGEWGEFFPGQMSPFAYNETEAQNYFPLHKEQAFSEGYQWKDPDVREYQPQTYRVPDQIQDVPDSITNEILVCVCKDCEGFHGSLAHADSLQPQTVSENSKTCGKNFKIIPQELTFYREQGIPVPTLCHDCRHRGRMRLRNPRKLWERECMQCGAPIQTTYAPDRPEKVYCEKCYLQSVY